MAAVVDFLKSLLDILAPHSCPGCGRSCDREGSVFCNLCSESIENVPPVVENPVGGILKLLSPFAYGGAISEAIIRCKHGENPAIASVLAEFAARNVEFPECDIIIPVPLHRTRLAFRGFNQSAMIAMVISKITGFRWSSSVLERCRKTESMKGLSRSERGKNVEGAFSVIKRAVSKIRDKKILLVDDVWTSGATASACAKALIRGGAGGVICFTICRVV